MVVRQLGYGSLLISLVISYGIGIGSKGKEESSNPYSILVVRAGLGYARQDTENVLCCHHLFTVH